MKTYFIAIPVLIAMLTSCGGGGETSEVAAEDSGCATDAVTYSATIVPILEANCMRCHNEEDYSSKADGVQLAGYENIKKKVDEGLVYGNVAHLPGFLKMPKRSAKIDQCDIDKIKAWIDQGAPNN